MGQDMAAAKGGAGIIKVPPRERILKAADELFERHGIRGVGVEAIASAADTNKMTLYRHFASKDELVAAWLQRVVDDWNVYWDDLETTTDAASPESQLDLFLQGFGDAFERFASRGCPMLNSLAELKEQDHPARRVLDDYKASNRKRLIKFFKKIGVSEPTQAAEEFQLLVDGAKSCVQDLGTVKSRARFTHLAKTLLEARMAGG